MATRAASTNEPAPLTRDRIVQRTIELLDERGVDWLSMRKLAAELGVSAQALYWHFPNKDALSEAVVDAVAAELRTIPLGRGSVEQRLRRYCAGLREHWRRHPSALELGKRYVPSAAGEVARQGVELLCRFGFDEDDAADRHRALVWIVLGFVHVEQSLTRSTHHTPLDPRRTRYAVSIPESGDEPRELDADALFEQVVSIAIAGLRAEVTTD